MHQLFRLTTHANEITSRALIAARDWLCNGAVLIGGLAMMVVTPAVHAQEADALIPEISDAALEQACRPAGADFSRTLQSLTAAERWALAQLCRGETADFRTHLVAIPPQERVCSARERFVLRQEFLRIAAETLPGHRPVAITFATIETAQPNETADLNGLSMRQALTLRAVDIQSTLAIRDSHFEQDFALLGTRMNGEGCPTEINRDTILNNAAFDGNVVVLNVALAAPLRFENAEFHGQVTIRAVGLQKAANPNPTAPAARLLLKGAHAHRDVTLHSIRATPDWLATNRQLLWAEDLHVSRNLSLTDINLRAANSLKGARVSGDFTITEVKLEARPGSDETLPFTTFDLSDLHVQRDVVIGNLVVMEGWEPGHPDSVSFDRSRIDGDLRLSNSTLLGSISLRETQIARTLQLAAETENTQAHCRLNWGDTGRLDLSFSEIEHIRSCPFAFPTREGELPSCNRDRETTELVDGEEQPRIRENEMRTVLDGLRFESWPMLESEDPEPIIAFLSNGSLNCAGSVLVEAANYFEGLSLPISERAALYERSRLELEMAPSLVGIQYLHNIARFKPWWVLLPLGLIILIGPLVYTGGARETPLGHLSFTRKLWMSFDMTIPFVSIDAGHNDLVPGKGWVRHAIYVQRLIGAGGTIYLAAIVAVLVF